jgi:hypothetical protein
VEGVPSVRPEVLQARLDFLLSDRAVEQQLAAPLLPGQTPYTAELNVWERQMRDLRKIYRAQYMQKLSEVVAEERRRELALHEQERAERRQRRLEKLQKQSIEMKRSALLLDRKRIEAKVNETVEMTRRSKLKIRKLMFLKKIQDMKREVSDVDVEGGKKGSPTAKDNHVLDRNVSAPFLVRQLGGAVDLPKQKNRRIHRVDNAYREVLEQSYDLHPEHEDDFAVSATQGELTPQQRAQLYYTNFSPDEKLELIEQKIHMLQERQMAEEIRGSADPLTAQLMDLLAAAKAAHLEKEQVERMTSQAERDDASDDSSR